MATDTKAIQKFTGNDEQRLVLLNEYNPTEHLLEWEQWDKAKGCHVKVHYYPAGWRLYELRLRYPTAKFDINIILMDQDRNFCVVQAKLYVGADYETAEVRSIAHKQGPLTDLDRVETKAKARAARDMGISTELALDMDDIPQGEPVQKAQPPQNQQPPKTKITEEKLQRSKEVAHQLDNDTKARLNSLYDRAMALRLLKTGNGKHFLMFVSKVLGEEVKQPQDLAKDKLDKVDIYLTGKEKEASEAQSVAQEVPAEVVEA